MGQMGHQDRRVLLVHPDEAFGQILRAILVSPYTLSRVPNVQAAIARLDSQEIDVILLNLDLPDHVCTTQDARALLKAAFERAIPIPVIVYGGDLRREITMELFRQGVTDFLQQPLDVQELKFALDAGYRRTTLARDLAAARSLLQTPHVDGLLGNCKAMEPVNEIIRKVADVATTVLLTGESGTGKNIAAQAIHRLSARADRPFVAFSPSSLPESLIENELFGHEKGAFTGATQTHLGRFEEANGGTIFLDEIGDLALHLQTRLLRVLQERTLERLGSHVAHRIDVRVICATHRNLEKMVQQGTFREDLYFRISVVKVHMPPLRERTEDIPLLAEYFLRMFAKTHNKRARGLTVGFLSALVTHNWPGNVRELQNVIERSVILANENLYLGVEDLPPELQGLAVVNSLPRGSYQQALRFFKRHLVQSALHVHSGNKLRAARELGISRCYLHRLLNQLDVKNEGNEEDDEILHEEDAGLAMDA